MIKSINGEHFPTERERCARPSATGPTSTCSRTTSRPTKERADRQLRLLRLAAPLRGARADDGGGDVLRQAGIATGYSGNLDFMTAENSFLVPTHTSRIGPDAEPYPADGDWAEPDLDHAAG